MLSDPDNMARFGYLTLLGVVFGSAVLYHYRNRLGAGLRDAAIWALVFLGFITIYGFKDQFSAGLFPGHAVKVENGAIALRRGDDGHFVADLRVNGEWVNFMVDTGASGIVLTKDDARRVGLDPDNLNYWRTARTANGSVATAPVQLDELRLGDIVDRNVRASVNDGEMSGSLLGLDYLDRFNSYTVEGDTLYLRR